MEPHELIDRLVKRAGGTYKVAGAMGARTFQGTLHKICSGFVKSPKRDSAQKIADFFKIPVEALYDAETATEVWQSIKDAAPGPAVMASPLPVLSAKEEAAAPLDLSWPFRTISRSDLAGLAPHMLADLEELMRVHIAQMLRATAAQTARVANGH
jgi:transcriptional regulator with XRE-family HTH domain